MVCISQHPQHKGHESETWWVCHSYNVYTFFFWVFCLGWLLHLRSYDCVSAQGKLSLSGLPEPRLQQKSGWPAEWHVSVWEVWQGIPQLQVPPHPLCKWFSVGPPKSFWQSFLSFFFFLSDGIHLQKHICPCTHWKIVFVESWVNDSSNTSNK